MEVKVSRSGFPLIPPPPTVSSLIRSKANGSYYVQFFQDTRTPKRKQVPLKVKDERTARKLKVQVDDLVLSGKMDPWVDTDFLAVLLGPQIRVWTLADAADEFVSAKKDAGRSKATLDTYTQCLRSFASHVGSETKITDVTPVQITKWINSTRANTVSSHKMRRHLSAFFRWMSEHRGACTPDGNEMKNPARKVELAKMPQKNPRWIRPEEVGMIIAAVQEHIKDRGVRSSATWIIPVIRTNVTLGFRAGEVCAIQWKDVSFSERTVSLHTPKGKIDRTVPMSQIVFDDLIRVREDRAEHSGVMTEDIDPQDFVFKTSHGAGRLCSRHLSRRFKEYVRLALPDHRACEVNFHTTRHTAASYLAQAGKSAEFIRDYMGHSSIQVTQKYMHLDRKQADREAVGVFDSISF